MLSLQLGRKLFGRQLLGLLGRFNARCFLRDVFARGDFFAALAVLAFFKTIFFLITGFFLATVRDFVAFLGFAIANLTSRVVLRRKTGNYTLITTTYHDA